MSNPSPGFRKHPEHTITVEPYGGHVTVRAGGKEIASSDKALVLKEASYPPVLYVPFSDIAFDALEATETSTHCPFKGDASYWGLKGGDSDVMWAYQHPYDEMTRIIDYGAFDPKKVEVEATAA